MEKYVLTNVRFPQEVYDRLKRLALQEGESVAGIVREAVSAYLTKRDGKTLRREELANDPFFQVIGIGQSGIANNSVTHDLIYRDQTDSSGISNQAGVARDEANDESKPDSHNVKTSDNRHKQR